MNVESDLRFFLRQEIQRGLPHRIAAAAGWRECEGKARGREVHQHDMEVNVSRGRFGSGDERNTSERLRDDLSGPGHQHPTHAQSQQEVALVSYPNHEAGA